MLIVLVHLCYCGEDRGGCHHGGAGFCTHTHTHTHGMYLILFVFHCNFVVLQICNIYFIFALKLQLRELDFYAFIYLTWIIK